MKIKIRAAQNSKNNNLSLTGLQKSYFAGKSKDYILGGKISSSTICLECSDFNEALFSKAVTEVLENNTIFFYSWNNEGKAALKNEINLEIEILESRTLEQELQNIQSQDFDLENPPLLQIKIIKDLLSGNKVYLLFHFCGLICDGLSLKIFCDELNSAYKSQTENSAEIKKLSSFEEYALMQENLKAFPFYEDDKLFWTKEINANQESFSAALIPFIKEPENVKSICTKQIQLKIEKIVVKKVSDYAEKNHLSQFSIFLAFFAKSIELYSSVKDFSILVPLAFRPPFIEDVSKIIGMCSSFTIYRNSKWADSLKDELSKTDTKLKQLLDHTFFQGTEVLNLFRNLTGKTLQPLISFTSLVDFSNGNTFKETESENFTSNFALTDLRTYTSQLALEAILVQKKDDLFIQFSYENNLISDFLAQGIIQTFYENLKNFDENKKDQLVLCSRDQKLIDKSFANNLENTCFSINAMLLENIKPDNSKTAVFSSLGDLTYNQLFHKISIVQHKLTEAGLLKGDVAAICLKKGYEQLVCAVSCILAGFVYMPVEYELPGDAQKSVLNSTKAKLIIFEEEKASFYESFNIKKLSKDFLFDEKDSDSFQEILNIERKPDEPVIIINTSGSTGNPKSVILKQSSVIQCILNSKKIFNISKADNFMCITNFAHDMAIFDTLAAFCYGSSVTIPDCNLQKEPSHWIDLINKYHVTLWNSVPAFLNMLTTYAASERITTLPLQTVITGGDFISPVLCKKLLNFNSELNIFSVGGPTETTIWNIFHKVQKEDLSASYIPYGKAFPDTKYLILDSSLNECPLGEKGIMFVEGASLSLGYAGNEELTKEKFKLKNGKLLYNTGDLGFVNENGEIIIQGRIDRQIKINGKTINLEGIEKFVNELDFVNSAVVVYSSEFKEIGAFYISDAAKSYDDFVTELSKKLPPYMLPKKFIKTESFPLSKNGKIDRKKLLSCFEEDRSKKADLQKTSGTLDEVSFKLLEICKKVFKSENVDINSNFFIIGGDSLKAVEIVSEIKKAFDIQLMIYDLLNIPLIGEWSKIIYAALKQKNEEKSLKEKKEEKASLNLWNFIVNAVKSFSGSEPASEKSSILEFCTDFSVIEKICSQIKTQTGKELSPVWCCANPFFEQWLAVLED